MKLNRTKLLAACDRAIKAEGCNAAVVLAAKQKKHDDALIEWRRTKATQLAKELRAMADRAVRGRPVHSDEVRDLTGYSSGARRLTWDGPSQRPKELLPPYTPDPDVRALQAFLAAVKDEEITTHQLSSLGFRNLEHVYRLAASA